MPGKQMKNESAWFLFSSFALDDRKISLIKANVSAFDRQMAPKNRLSCPLCTLRAEVSSPLFKLDRRETSAMNHTNLFSMRKGLNYVYAYDWLNDSPPCP